MPYIMVWHQNFTSLVYSPVAVVVCAYVNDFREESKLGRWTLRKYVICLFIILLGNVGGMFVSEKVYFP